MKFVKDFVIPVVVLTVICVVVSAALVFTYQATKPIIDEAKNAEANAARRQLWRWLCREDCI